MTIQMQAQYDAVNEFTTHHISGFNLQIGNNYTADHFIRFLMEQRQDVIDLLASVELDDDVVFEFRGTYGNHHEHWAMSDLADYLRAHNG